MTGMADYVGAEPEGLRSLALALDVAKGELRYANDRIQALLAEAGDGDVTCGALSVMAGEVTLASADIRTRATMAEDLIRGANTPECVVRWYDPLLRAPAAIKSNSWNAGAGTANAIGETGSTVWRLAPTHEGWTREWVNLGAGLQAAVDDPGAALEAAAGFDDLDERGHSYWLGGMAPDIVTAFGGVGIGTRLLRMADKMLDAADAANEVGRVSSLVAKTRKAVVEGPDIKLIRRRPQPDPVLEPLAKEMVLKRDFIAEGHSAARHGPDTTLEEQRIRAETKVTPDGRADKFPRDASRFFRWQDQADAILEAERRWRAGEQSQSINITFPHLVGEGFLAGTDFYRQSHVVTVRLNASGRAYSSYPNLKVGQ